MKNKPIVATGVTPEGFHWELWAGPDGPLLGQGPCEDREDGTEKAKALWAQLRYEQRKGEAA